MVKISKNTIISFFLSTFIIISFFFQTEFTNKNDNENIGTEDFLLSPSISSSLDNTELLSNLTWNTDTDTKANDVWNDETAIYVVGESINSSDSYDINLVLIKYDLDFNEIWIKEYGELSNYETGNALWGNGNFIYTFGEKQGPDRRLDFLLIKWDSDGNLIWSKTWGYSHDEQANGIWGDNDSIYTCGGSYYTHPSGGAVYLMYGLVLIKWDFDGNIIWEERWEDINSNLFAIHGNSDSIFVVGFSLRTRVPFLFKWSKNGVLIWDRQVPEADRYGLRSVKCNGSDIFICGYREDEDEPNRKLYLSKWDTDGNKIWEQFWDDNDEQTNFEGSDIIINNSNIFTVGNYYDHDDSPEKKSFLALWDINGSNVWYKVGDAHYPETINSFCLINDNFYCVGYNYDYDRYNYEDDFRIFLTQWGPGISPELEELTFSRNITLGSDAEILASVREYHIDSVMISYFSGIIWKNRSLTKISSNSLLNNFSFTLLSRYLDVNTTIIFRIFANDTSGNSYISEEYSILIIPDTKIPEILDIKIHQTTDSEDNIMIYTFVKDDNLATVILSLKIEDFWQNLTMDLNKPYYYMANLSKTIHNFDQNVTFKICANDIYGNYVESQVITFNIQEEEEVEEEMQIPAYQTLIFMSVIGILIVILNSKKKISIWK